MKYGVRRTGWSTLEAVLSMGLLSLFLCLSLKWTLLGVQQVKKLREERIVNQAMSNMMQLVMALPYEDLTAERIQEHSEILHVSHAAWRIVTEVDIDDTVGIAGSNAPAEDVPAASPRRILVRLKREYDQTDLPTALSHRELVAWRYPHD